MEKLFNKLGRLIIEKERTENMIEKIKSEIYRSIFTRIEKEKNDIRWKRK